MAKKSNQFVLNICTKMSSNELPLDLKETFSLHLLLFKIAGFNIFDDVDKSFIRRYYHLIFSNFMFISMTVLTVIYILVELSRSTFLDIANGTPFAALYVQDVAGFLALICKKNEIKALIRDIAEVWPTDLGGNKIKEEIKKNWLRNMAVFNRANIVVFIIATFLFCIPSLILTLIEKYVNGGTAFVYPFYIYYFCENTTTITWYLLVFLSELICGASVHICTHVASNLLLATLSCNVGLMMRLLQIDLENVLKLSNGRAVYDEVELKNIIKVHQKLLRITDKFNECFGVVIFISVGFSALLIGFFTFLVLALDKMYLVVTFAMSFEILNLTWPGQLLADMSYTVAEAAYSTQWYDSDLKFKGFIYVIIQRSQKPAQLSALGFSDLTLELFARVLSSAWSYLSIFNCVQSDPQ